MKAFVEYIVKALVDYPDQVVVNEVSSDHTVLLEVRLVPTDNGKIIGRQGHTITAIRTLLSSVAAKNGKRAMLELTEDDKHRSPRRDDTMFANP
jgi:predicted RNA-binding protein YlqC (UPF0109 family)